MKHLPAGAAIAAVLVSSASAQVSIGVDFELAALSGERTHVEANTGNPVTEGEWDRLMLSAVPSVAIRVSEILEVNPRAGVTYTNNTGTDGVGIVAACGAYFHVVRGEVFGLCLGPDVAFPVVFGNDLIDLTANVGLPVNIDLHVTPRMFVRMGFRAAEVYFHLTSWDDQGNTVDRREHTVGVNLQTMFTPVCGFYFTF